MAKIKLEVNGESARAFVTEGILTHGAVGVEIDVIVTGTQWDGIPYQVICISNGVAMPALPIDGTATVPHERLVGGAHLYLGIDGSNQPGTLRIPASLADCGTVATSTAEYDPEHPAPPTPDIYVQIMAAIESGRLTGKDGYSPTVGVQLIDGGYRITITDKDGPKSFDLRNGRDGEPGKDYILTDADKQQIAGMVPAYDDTEIKREQIELKQGLTQCLKTPAEANVGQIFAVKSKNADGSVVLEAVNAPDLTDYVKNTDYATANKGGAVKIESWLGHQIASNGALRGASYNAATYQNRANETFISKGTLDNVLSAPSIQPALTSEEQLAGR